MGNCFPLHARNSSSGDSTPRRSSDDDHEHGDDQHLLSPASTTAQSSSRARQRNRRRNNQTDAMRQQSQGTTSTRAHISYEQAVSSSTSQDAMYSEEQQIAFARRVSLIQRLPTDVYVEGGKGDSECIICMIEMEEGDRIRFLPCMHSYHVQCIDDWLQRKFQCPSCMEPVEAGLLSSFTTAETMTSDFAAIASSAGSTGATARTPPTNTSDLQVVSTETGKSKDD